MASSPVEPGYPAKVACTGAGFAGKDQQPVASHVQRRIDENVDSVPADGLNGTSSSRSATSQKHPYGRARASENASGLETLE